MDQKPNPGADPLVPLISAHSPFEAGIVVAVLEAAGIPAVAPGSMLADEFAMSQRLMNLQSVRVLVPRSRLADAEQALSEARADGTAPEVEERSEDAHEEVVESRTGVARWKRISIVLYLVLPLLWLIYSLLSQHIH